MRLRCWSRHKHVQTFLLFRAVAGLFTSAHVNLDLCTPLEHLSTHLWENIWKSNGISDLWTGVKAALSHSLASCSLRAFSTSCGSRSWSTKVDPQNQSHWIAFGSQWDCSVPLRFPILEYFPNVSRLVRCRMVPACRDCFGSDSPGVSWA